MDGPQSFSLQIYGISVCSYDISIYYSCTHYHLAWNLACGFAQNESQLLAFRFLSGLGGSAPPAVCNPFLNVTLFDYRDSR